MQDKTEHLATAAAGSLVGQAGKGRMQFYVTFHDIYLRITILHYKQCFGLYGNLHAKPYDCVVKPGPRAQRSAACNLDAPRECGAVVCTLSRWLTGGNRSLRGRQLLPGVSRGLLFHMACSLFAVELRCGRARGRKPSFVAKGLKYDCGDRAHSFRRLDTLSLSWFNPRKLYLCGYWPT